MATLIAMRAATLGITLDTLEVVIDSESDDRGILSIDETVPAGPLSGHVSVRVLTDGVDAAKLQEIANLGRPTLSGVRRP